MSFDFKNAQIPESSARLTPGVYSLTATAAEGGTSPNKGTEYVEVTFSGKAGSLKEKFFLTEKAIGRLKYLHQAIYEKDLERVFNKAEEIVAYFDKLFKAKAVEKQFIVGGKEAADGRVFTNLPFGGFIVPDELRMLEGPFDKMGPMWMQYVQKAVISGAVASTDDVMLPSNASLGDKEDDFGDLPF